jgi:hypothetical protein
MAGLVNMRIRNPRLEGWYSNLISLGIKKIVFYQVLLTN